MGKKVTVYTSAFNVETGESVSLAPGDEAPDWAELGDHVYEDQSGLLAENQRSAGPSVSGEPPKDTKKLQSSKPTVA